MTTVSSQKKTNGDREKIHRIYGAGSFLSATASIYTFAAFLYAAKALNVSEEAQRDPYWT
jgi:hypothetical protein